MNVTALLRIGRGMAVAIGRFFVPESIISGDAVSKHLVEGLPVCRWRGPLEANGLVKCDSVKIIKPDEGINPAVCRGCVLADHAPCEPPPRETPAAFPELTCRHRGERRRDQLCPTCAGSVKVFLFACGLKGECTLRKPLPLVACCNECLEREPL